MTMTQIEVERMYGSVVPDADDAREVPQDVINAAKKAVEETAAAKVAYRASLKARARAIRALDAAGAEAGMSQNEMARRIGLAASTFRDYLKRI